jgi:hypothetical protein
MYKQDLLDYISLSKQCGDGQRSGAAKMVAKMLGISDVAVCNWGEEIPMRRAMQLHNLLRDKKTLAEYGLPRRGAPRFESDVYE